MATAILVDAAIGLVFDQLFRTVSKVVQKPMMYSSNLERMKATLTSITSMAKEIDGFNRVLDRRKEEVEHLMKIIKEGEELVCKCVKIKWWNFNRKSRYVDKIRELEKALESFCQMAMQFQQTRDQMETLLEVKDLRMDLRRLSSNESNGGFGSQAGFMGMCNPTKPSELTVGLDVPLEELKLQLFKDGVQVIVVSAPGGSGKTTLAKMLCHDEEVKGKFQDIFFVNVSKSANLKAIIQKIFQHKGSQVPEFQSDEDAVNHFELLLNKTRPCPILLVLDDVWSGSEYLLDKLRLHITDYKILVTSRSVFPRFGSTYKLEKLNDECAMTLFRHSACLIDGNSPIPDEDLVNKIVKSCKGSPLVLSVVGRSLCGQPEAIWQSRVMEWSEGGSIFVSNYELLDRLQSSLNVLDNKRKACYLDLGSFPEDQMIPATYLIDMWYELYNLHHVPAIANLYDFSFRNLIDLSVTRKDDIDGDSCYKDYFVRQHDLLRELAIYRSSLEPIESRERVFLDIGGDNTPDWWIQQNQQLIRARLLSISTDETFSSTWCDLQGPEVVALVLNFRSQNYKLPKFIEKMDKLKTLIITNYGVSVAEISDLLVLGSFCNIKRIRMELVSLPSLSLVQLQNLQKISLVMCNVGQAFKSPTFQMSHAFPNLVEVNFEYCNDLVEFPASLCDLIHLKKLSITNCHKLSALPHEIGKLLNLEVLRLSSCIDLLELPDSIGSLCKLRVLDISDCLGIEELPTQIGDLHNLRKLYMIGCSSCMLPPSIFTLENLDLVICDEETSFLWEPFMPRLPKLRIKLHKEDVNLDWLNNL